MIVECIIGFVCSLYFESCFRFSFILFQFNSDINLLFSGIQSKSMYAFQLSFNNRS
jgi:hypothetical protein